MALDGSSGKQAPDEELGILEFGLDLAPIDDLPPPAGTASSSQAGGGRLVEGGTAPANQLQSLVVGGTSSPSQLATHTAANGVSSPSPAGGLGGGSTGSTTFRAVTTKTPTGLSVAVGKRAEEANPDGTLKARNVYVACLPLDFAEDELLGLLSPFGPLESCRLFSGTQRAVNSGRSYGFALYQKAEDARRCIDALNQTWLRGRKLQVRLSRNAVVQEPKGAAGGGGGSGSPTPIGGASLASTPNISATGTASAVGGQGYGQTSPPGLVAPHLPPAVGGGGGGGNSGSATTMTIMTPHGPAQLVPVGVASSANDGSGTQTHGPPLAQVGSGSGTNTLWGPPPPQQQQQSHAPIAQGHWGSPLSAGGSGSSANPSGPRPLSIPPPQAQPQQQQQQPSYMTYVSIVHQNQASTGGHFAGVGGTAPGPMVPPNYPNVASNAMHPPPN